MLVCFVVLVTGLLFVMGILYGNFGGQLQRELTKEAAYLKYGVEQQGVEYLQNISDKNSRITYIAQDGTVLFDNEADAYEMENHKDREEFQKAEKYGAGESSRYSNTLSEKTMYYALRLKNGNVLRVSGTQETVIALVKNLVLPLCWILFLMLVLSGIMASVISKRIVKPVNELIIIHTMMAFQKHPDIQGIAVVCLAGWETVLHEKFQSFPFSVSLFRAEASAARRSARSRSAWLRR